MPGASPRRLRGLELRRLPGPDRVRVVSAPGRKRILVPLFATLSCGSCANVEDCGPAAWDARCRVEVRLRIWSRPRGRAGSSLDAFRCSLREAAASRILPAVISLTRRIACACTRLFSILAAGERTLSALTTTTWSPIRVRGKARLASAQNIGDTCDSPTTRSRTTHAMPHHSAGLADCGLHPLHGGPPVKCKGGTTIPHWRANAGERQKVKQNRAVSMVYTTRHSNHLRPTRRLLLFAGARRSRCAARSQLGPTRPVQPAAAVAHIVEGSSFGIGARLLGAGNTKIEMRRHGGP